MAPRKGGKGGKKKNGGGKKRKRNVWDDFDPEREELQATIQAELAQEPKPKVMSMMGQWKKQKQAKIAKKKGFEGHVVDKKEEQYYRLMEQKKRQAEAIYYQRQVANTKQNDEQEGDDEANDQDDDDIVNDEDETSLKPKKKASLFDQFVQTFQPAQAMDDEDEEDEAESEYEEVLVDEDGNEIVEDEEDDEEEQEEEENEDETTAAEEDEEPEADDDIDDDDEEHKEEEESNIDPYRKRYVLNTFDEQDARKFDATPRKFIEQRDIAPAGMQLFFKPGTDGVQLPSTAVKSNKSLHIRKRLLETWESKQLDPVALFNRLEAAWEPQLFQQLTNYHDVLFAGQTYDNTATLRRLSVMHVLNHVIKSRDTITRNNERLRKRRDASADDQEDDKEYRDQGFCRASVLILCPLRSSAMAFVKLLLELLPSNVDTFHNKDRFFREYGVESDEDDEDKNSKNDDDDLKEWQRVFAQGNNDDCFQIGLSLSRKAMRFYSEYHHADIILASPLGLRQQLGDQVVELDDDNDGEKKISMDFLSSIEVCVVDSASLIMMQNLEHLRNVLKATNLQPKEASHADFSRIREWNLAFLATYFRQTIVYAHGLEPTLHAVMNQCCRNMNGMIKYTRLYDDQSGTAPAITQVVPQVQQLFQRLDVGVTHLTAVDEVELRFAYFEKHIFQKLLDHPKKHVLIVVPSYLDYVRIRNLFGDPMNKKLISCVQCCEYTTPKQISRARTSFFHGRSHVMLVTERFHFYHQYTLRGIHQLIWYGLPMMDEFYTEMLNMLTIHNTGVGAADDHQKSSIALFTRLDFLRLQRILGHQRAERMCQRNAKKATYMFC